MTRDAWRRSGGAGRAGHSVTACEKRGFVFYSCFFVLFSCSTSMPGCRAEYSVNSATGPTTVNGFIISLTPNPQLSNLLQPSPPAKESLSLIEAPLHTQNNQTSVLFCVLECDPRAARQQGKPSPPLSSSASSAAREDDDACQALVFVTGENIRHSCLCPLPL